MADVSGAFATLSPSEIRSALSSRERYEVQNATALEATAEVTIPELSNAELRSKISDRAYDLIVQFETGGRGYYESPHGINSRPCWPGGASGVTIGCGYDLGYNSEVDFRATWRDKLSPADITVLAGAIGKKGQAARSFMPRVSHIIIPWGVALAVFDATDLPREELLTLRSLPRAIELHPHCVGALVSLVFNRGASFSLSDDRYREMREIARLIRTGDFKGVPAQFRAMKRLWEGTGQSGLLIRRDKEAQLFQDGLDAMVIANQSENLATLIGAGSAAEAIESPLAGSDPNLSWLDSLTDDQLDALIYGKGVIADGPPQEIPDDLEASAIRYDKSDVRWVLNDRNHPDYVHLPPDAKGTSFNLTPNDLERLIASNRFQPYEGDHHKIIFALRGAKLTSNSLSQEGVDELQLVDARPNHFNFQCVIGIYDKISRKLFAYTGSTVCNAGAVVACYNYYNHFSPEKQGNILLTGCYQMCVGTHYGHVTVPGVFRLGDGRGPENATKHLVLRTGNDVTFGTQDIFDPCVPQDNLHPSFHPANSKFSSLGCLTVHGTYSNGHQEEWKKFRAAAGLHASSDGMGTRYDMVVLTGLDAATAVMRRTLSDQEFDGILACIRQGSRGDQVKALQAKLGMPSPDGVFDWQTAEKLVQTQKSILGWASATYGRNMDTLLGFGIFTQPGA